jgi:MerR family transcriptional regulator, copper efflux regulator
VKSSGKSYLTRGQLARRVGISVETVRFYERIGLLPHPPRSPGGYRQYPPATTQRLEFIRHARVLGLGLADIEALLDGAPEPGSERARRHERALAEIEARAEALDRLNALRRGEGRDG